MAMPEQKGETKVPQLRTNLQPLAAALVPPLQQGPRAGGQSGLSCEEEEAWGGRTWKIFSLMRGIQYPLGRCLGSWTQLERVSSGVCGGTDGIC